MNNGDWLPPLIELAHADGVWAEYCELVYAAFSADFLSSQPQLWGRWVRCRRDPISLGKEAGFWHCVSTGKNEATRIPETNRCERIRWARAIIENANDRRVDAWRTVRGTDYRQILWFREEYVIVLSERKRERDGFEYYQLITAYCTEYEDRKESLRRERDGSRNG